MAAHSDFANITYNKSIAKLKLNKGGGGIIKFNVCPICKFRLVSSNYNGVGLCEECIIDAKLEDNTKTNMLLEDNTFIRTKYGKTHVGSIIGYQHKTNNAGDDKYYVYMNVNEDNYSIWSDGWKTERELIQFCDNYKINVDDLLK